MYKVFTPNVQSKCINYTNVYKATFLERIQPIFKNLLAYFPSPRMGDIP